MKLSATVINRMIDLTCSKTEINMMCYLAKYQMDNGLIVNMYYKQLIKDLNVHMVTVYRVLDKLEAKGIITRELCNGKYGYFNIKINDNDFSDKDFSEGYVNVNKAVFNTDFYKLRATEKYVVLKLMLRNNDRENEIKAADETIATYGNISKKNIRIINRILDNIKDLKFNGNVLFEVFTQDRRKTRVHFFKLKYTGKILSSAKYFMQHDMFVRYLNKNKVKFDLKDIEDLVQMDNQYMAYNGIYKNVVTEIVGYYGTIECKAIRHKMDGIVERIRANTFGIEKIEPIF